MTPDWKPIETAPHGEMLLLYRPNASAWGRVAPGKWDADEYARRPRPYWEGWLKIGGKLEWRAWEPTHWMHLPAPPET